MGRIIKTALSFLAVAALMLWGAFPAYAEKKDTADEISSVIGGIADFKMNECGASSVQEWIDGGISESVGAGGEWYILALRDSECDLSRFVRSLDERVVSDGKLSAASSLRYALFFLAAGDETHSEYIQKCAYECIGAQGIMSLVFGLHLLNNGVVSSAFTRDELAENIISLQLADGGWAVMGDHGDTDVTAMTVQALAPLYDENESVRTAVDSALSRLSELQNEDGGYASFGKPNPESASQVLLALSSIGIDFSEDERFIKNGRTVLDGIKKYRLADGSFEHESGGGYNATATNQAYYCLYSYLKMQNGGRLYIFDKRSSALFDKTDIPDENIDAKPAPESTSPTSSEPAPEAAFKAPENTSKTDIKLIIFICIGGFAAAACLILFLSGKRSIKNFIFVLTIAGAAALITAFSSFSTAEEYYSSDGEKKDIIGSVTFSISCNVLIGEENENIPADGFIVPAESVPITDGDTVRDILIETVKKHGIQLDCGADSYVRGINYLYEFDYGDLSGWMYHVNGEAPSVNCGSFVLSDGDNIEWLYTLSMGEDLK